MIVKEQSETAQAEFGGMLRRWREKNGWTQYTASDWAKAATQPFAAPPPSGLSELETGKTKHPRDQWYLYLGELNARVAAADFKGVTNRKILDVLRDSQPITDEAGNPWGPTAFWECHAGLRPIPDWLLPVPLVPVPILTVDTARNLGDSWREDVRKIGADAGLRPMAAISQFTRVCPSGAREAIEDGLAGGFTPETIATCWDPESGEWGPTAWIVEWAQALGDGTIPSKQGR
jgi:hypothetical protein